MCMSKGCLNSQRKAHLNKMPSERLQCTLASKVDCLPRKEEQQGLVVRLRETFNWGHVYTCHWAKDRSYT